MAVRLSAEGVRAKGHVIDLNNAGAFIATELVLEKNRPLRILLEVRAAGRRPWLEAVVMRRTERIVGRRLTIPAGLGVVFVAATKLEREFIQRAVVEALTESRERKTVADRSAAGDDGRPRR